MYFDLLQGPPRSTRHKRALRRSPEKDRKSLESVRPAKKRSPSGKTKDRSSSRAKSKSKCEREGAVRHGRGRG